MIVRRISQVRGGCCEASFDDGRVCRLHLETAMAAGLRPGCELDEAALGELLYASELCLAKEYALRILSARACTRKRLTERLRERYDEDIAAETAQLMEDAGLLDDAGLAFVMAADMLRLKGYGDARVSQELRRRGISSDGAEEAIDRAYEEFADEIPCEEERIAEIIRRRAPDLSDEKQKRRTIDSLIRLGYDYGDIKRALREFDEEE